MAHTRNPDIGDVICQRNKVNRNISSPFDQIQPAAYFNSEHCFILPQQEPVVIIMNQLDTIRYAVISNFFAVATETIAAQLHFALLVSGVVPIILFTV